MCRCCTAAVAQKPHTLTLRYQSVVSVQESAPQSGRYALQDKEPCQGTGSVSPSRTLSGTPQLRHSDTNSTQCWPLVFQPLQRVWAKTHLMGVGTHLAIPSAHQALPSPLSLTASSTALDAESGPCSQSPDAAPTLAQAHDVAYHCCSYRASSGPLWRLVNCGAADVTLA